MKLIIGKKLNMTQVYSHDGTVTPVTIVRVGNGTVTQIKNLKNDGYCAVQFGFSEGSKNVNKAIAGHVSGLVRNPKLIEMRIDNVDGFEKGQTFDVSVFEKGEKVWVSGLSKGRGFQGVVKRHGFHGSDKTHGSKHSLRSPGSIGATDPQRVFPGMKMAGRMGNNRVTVKNLEIIDIDAQNGIIKIKGAVPGARGGLVEIRSAGQMASVSQAKNIENNEAEDITPFSQEDKK